MSSIYQDIPDFGGGSASGDVNIHDAAGGALNSTGGALNVNITSGSSEITGTVTSVEAGLDVFKTSQYTVGITAVQLTPFPLTNRSSISVTVTTTISSAAVYIGSSSSVTTSGPNGGWPLYDGDTLQLDLTDQNEIYAISTVGGQTVYTLEIA